MFVDGRGELVGPALERRRVKGPASARGTEAEEQGTSEQQDHLDHLFLLWICVLAFKQQASSTSRKRSGKYLSPRGTRWGGSRRLAPSCRTARARRPGPGRRRARAGPV